MTGERRATHVIVGGGPAGVTAVETIRHFDPDGASVLLVAGEPPYARMVLPYYLAGDVDEERLYSGDAAYFRQRGVDVLFGRRAVALEPQRQRLLLDDGTTVRYQRLLIATGASPLLPPVAGIGQKGVLPMWALADARSFLSRVSAGGRVAVMGAGFIGLILLNALHRRGLRVTYVEREAQILPRMLDAQGASLVQRWLERKGVEVITGATVTAIAAVGHRKRLILGSGKASMVDVVIVATGVRPNTDFLAGSGVAIDQGVLVDQYMRTSVSH
ncbi:MAG: NAD(P)/FAD-dependent oxidoreductase [Dehalococcoidia bacterium]